MHFSREAIEAAQTPEELRAILSAVESAPGQWVAPSLSVVAEFFRLATSTIKGWRSDGMPGSDSGWPLDQIVRWRIERLTNNDLVTVRKEQEIELNAIAIEQKRLDLNREKGELLARADVERWAATALISAREVFMAAPEVFAASCPQEIRDFVRAESDRICRDTLTTLQRRLESDELDKELTTPESESAE